VEESDAAESGDEVGDISPIYVPNYIVGSVQRMFGVDDSIEVPYIDHLIERVPWVNEQERRRECFMSNVPREYQYIPDGPIYKSVLFESLVQTVMEKINSDYGYRMNVCFLNYYQDQTKALGWHADDAKEIDQSQPICVVTFGQAREIWWRKKGEKGDVPAEQRKLLEDGSLFIMPAGMQDTHFHRIPKGDRAMGPRVSLTYRCWKE
jgi:alkylated DNA repair dioxygenase AlkB